jgi:hypothetical protein
MVQEIELFWAQALCGTDDGRLPRGVCCCRCVLLVYSSWVTWG